MRLESAATGVRPRKYLAAQAGGASPPFSRLWDGKREEKGKSRLLGDLSNGEGISIPKGGNGWKLRPVV